MAEIIGQQDNFGAVQVIGLTEFIKDLRTARDKGAADKLIREANERVAKIVIRTARSLANTKQERKAAASLETSSNVQQVKVTMGGRDAPYAGGANFGSYTDLRRLIKAPNQRGRRGRATVVREGESILKVATRVESQFVSRSGRTVSAFEGGTRVKLSRTSGGALRVVRGWNQFRAKGQQPTPYAKGRDQFLYRAVTMTQDQISESYQRFIDESIGKAFPDKSVGDTAA
jgi:hypothetical protein